MAEGMYRIGVVGATSLLGKELSDELQESLLAASDFVLFDEDEVLGQVAAVGDEASFIQRIEADSFKGMDFVFFAGDGAETKKHWLAARKAGASLVDLTGALEGEPGVAVRGPLSGVGAKTLGLEAVAVVPAATAAVMLAVLAGRLAKAGEVRVLAATVIEPASEHGREAMDELHQQTVNLLGFQELPKDQYDAQVAFNVLPALGEEAKFSLDAVEERIARHYRGLGELPELALQVVQAPVFHGYCASVLVEFAGAPSMVDVEGALAGEGVDVVGAESDPPSNLSAAGQEDVMVRVKAAGTGRFWLWVAADNLKLGALNGIACALELRKLRPRGKVQ